MSWNESGVRAPAGSAGWRSRRTLARRARPKALAWEVWGGRSFKKKIGESFEPTGASRHAARHVEGVDRRALDGGCELLEVLGRGQGIIPVLHSRELQKSKERCPRSEECPRQWMADLAKPWDVYRLKRELIAGGRFGRQQVPAVG